MNIAMSNQRIRREKDLAMEANPELKWIITSLFCTQANWCDLLRDGIRPFLMQSAKEKILHSFYLEFNYISGDNIRLMLLCDMDKAEQLAQKTDTWFKSFFAGAGYPDNEPAIPTEGCFLPFPSNTIRYGLYQPHGNMPNEHDKQHDSFRNGLSSLILEIFSEEAVNDESILVLAFYLHMSWIQLLQRHDFTETNNLLQPYFLLNIVNIEKLNESFIKASFEKNKDMLLQIADDIRHNNQPGAAQEIHWLNRWNKLCEFELKNHSGLQSAHLAITNCIDKHMGLTYDMKSLLFHFIKQTYDN